MLHRIRATDCRIPVIILTARGGAEDVVAGLEGGADDYVSKPFDFAELLARIRLRLLDENDVVQHVLHTAGLRWTRGDIHSPQETQRWSLRRGNSSWPTFVRTGGRVLSLDHLLTAAWGDEELPGSNVVDVYVRYLRRKLRMQWITTVHGKGYRLDPDDIADETG